ncbi:hypothetical protein BH20ACT17_BH20ACT17_16800 [soil metagenome]
MVGEGAAVFRAEEEQARKQAEEQARLQAEERARKEAEEADADEIMDKLAPLDEVLGTVRRLGSA